MKTRFWFMAALIVAAAALRIFPHPPNVAPVAAIALFGGAHFDRRVWAFVVPLGAMLLSDAVLGFHEMMPVVYGSFAATVVIGMWLRGSHRRAVPVASATLGAATLFYLTTNFAVWAGGTMYPMTGEGLLACYVAAIPYFGWSVAGDLMFVGLLFGGFSLAERRLPALAAR